MEGDFLLVKGVLAEIEVFLYQYYRVLTGQQWGLFVELVRKDKMDGFHGQCNGGRYAHTTAW